jgi:hypothetical protein
MREIGLLLRPEPSYPGGGGSGGRYPSDVIPRAREALELSITYHRQLAFAVAIMYARGRYPIPEAKLRRALLQVIRRYRRELKRAADKGSSDDEAIAAGQTLAKRFELDPNFAAERRRIPRSKDRPKRSVLETISTALIRAHQTGEQPPAEVIEELFRIGGFEQVFPQDLLEQFVRDEVPVDVARLKLDDIEAAIRQATLAQFETVRDDALTWTDASRRFGAALPCVFADFSRPLEIPVSDESVLLTALTNLAELFNSPEGYQRELAYRAVLMTFIDASLAYSESLSSEFKAVAYVDNPMSEDELTTGQRQRLGVLKRDFAEKHPAYARLLGIK